ncbi:hypothetical protein HMPREF0762_01474 [Slackia exigua ATCC 700122]|uniref:Uncharacterized protein n=1 Tax=Slackia exigua (strain ATCC 700122 / DSM 15923 / CIP 105133 / JCM 11022 / KCTC 5966 / S-7) TaxID=649764 RepID=D0WI02_SLAES|nr:hypothetical protein HMPREF0762_01474 [Slackia exigua ATCC 700122]
MIARCGYRDRLQTSPAKRIDPANTVQPRWGRRKHRFECIADT